MNILLILCVHHLYTVVLTTDKKTSKFEIFIQSTTPHNIIDCQKMFFLEMMILKERKRMHFPSIIVHSFIKNGNKWKGHPRRRRPYYSTHLDVFRHGKKLTALLKLSKNSRSRKIGQSSLFPLLRLHFLPWS